MKLKIYDQNAQNRISKPRISFGVKTNQVRFNNHAVKLMDLKTGDKITIAMNEENIEEWFILKNTEEGIPLGLSKSDELFFGCKSLVEDFTEVFKLTKTIALPIVKEPIKNDKYGDLWLILTAEALKIAKEEALKLLRK